jgi:hypothetical protein
LTIVRLILDGTGAKARLNKWVVSIPLLVAPGVAPPEDAPLRAR